MKKISLLLSIACLGISSLAVAGSNDWVTRKTSWSAADEQVFQDLVTSLGDAVAERRCQTVSECMKNRSINFFAASDPSSVRHYADCADLPYYLRAYVAWKRDLPFTYASSVAPRDSRDPNGAHYSQSGNRVLSRRTLGNGQNPTNATQALQNIINEVYTGSFRTPLISDANDGLADYYPIEINRKSVTPGTALYDPDGHAYVVYKVESNGNVKFIDAHPDGTLTLSEINNSFSVSRQEHGWGFKKYRPYELLRARAVQDSQGTRYVGGEMFIAPDHMIEDYSVSHLSKKYYGHAGAERTDNYSFYLFTRERLSEGELNYDIVEEFQNVLSGLCNATSDRAFSVEQAIINGINRKPHPYSLPDNIYGTTGEWETFSTPSRDARLKSAFVAGFKHVADLIEFWNQGSDKVSYNGSDVYRDLYETYKTETSKCMIPYKNSAGSTVNLDLDDVRRRLWKISFDPYHCIELRWGAEGSELSSCRDNSEKMAWYKAEQQLRNQIDRRYDDRMDHSLGALQNFTPNSGKGVAQPPGLELINQLQQYGEL